MKKKLNLDLLKLKEHAPLDKSNISWADNDSDWELMTVDEDIENFLKNSKIKNNKQHLDNKCKIDVMSEEDGSKSGESSIELEWEHEAGMQPIAQDQHKYCHLNNEFKSSTSNPHTPNNPNHWAVDTLQTPLILNNEIKICDSKPKLKNLEFIDKPLGSNVNEDIIRNNTRKHDTEETSQINSHNFEVNMNNVEEKQDYFDAKQRDFKNKHISTDFKNCVQGYIDPKQHKWKNKEITESNNSDFKYQRLENKKNNLDENSKNNELHTYIFPKR